MNDFTNQSAAPALPALHRLSVADFMSMVEVGILRDDERIELIEGEMIDMAPIGSQHVSTVALLGKMLILAANNKAIVTSQSPVVLGTHSEPQPDLLLLKARSDYYANALPQPPDVLLLVEVADSSLNFDRNTKIPLYAKHGVPEVWLINLQDKALEIFREPHPGGYRVTLRPRREESISPMLFPDFSIPVERLFANF